MTGFLFSDGSGTKLSLLTSENYQEKLQTLEHMKGVHMCHWRAGQVLAWMEITLGMPMYGRNCALNVKSGKVSHFLYSQKHIAVHSCQK